MGLQASNRMLCPERACNKSFDLICVPVPEKQAWPGKIPAESCFLRVPPSHLPCTAACAESFFLCVFTNWKRVEKGPGGSGGHWLSAFCFPLASAPRCSSPGPPTSSCLPSRCPSQRPGRCVSSLGRGVLCMATAQAAASPFPKSHPSSAFSQQMVLPSTQLLPLLSSAHLRSPPSVLSRPKDPPRVVALGPEELDPNP